MSLAQFELYHGAVLSQIIGNPKVNVKLFERNSDHGWGAYEVSDNETTYRVVIKATAQVRKGRKGNCACVFTFSQADVDRLRKIEVDRHLLICLVCSDAEICTLEWGDIDRLGLLMDKSACSVSVSWAPNTGLHVKCRGVELVVPRNKLKNFEWA